MSKESIPDLGEMAAEASNALQLIEALEQVARSIDPEKVKVTEEQALEVRQEILDAIPETYRCLFPEDDTLAAFAYAPIFFMMNGR